MGSHFRACSHREFILFSVLPVLAATLGGRRGDGLLAIRRNFALPKMTDPSRIAA